MRLDARTALECHEYLHKSYAPKRFDLTLAKEEDEIVKEYKRQGLLHESNVKEFIAQLPLKIISIPESSNASEVQEMSAHALLNPEIDVILGCEIGAYCEEVISKLVGSNAIGDSSRVSRPDLLIRTGVGLQWAPVDIKFHTAFDSSNQSNQVIISNWQAHLPESGSIVSGKISEEDGLQLAHYHQHLSTLGIASKDYLVGIIGREYESIVWAKLNETKKGAGKSAPNYLNLYGEKFQLARNVVERSIKRNHDHDVPPPAIPRLTSGKFGCEMCSFKVICREEMEKFDNNSGHVTLLAQVTPSVAARHFPEVESIRDLSLQTNLSEVGEKARRRAQVWITKKPALVDPDEPLEIPEFDIEVDIDLENSQALLEEILPEERLPDDRVYLYGYGVHDRTITSDWRDAELFSIADFTNTDEAEYLVLTSMWSELERLALLAKTSNKSFGIFHYSHHEKTWWRRYSKRFEGKTGVPSLEHIETFMKTYFVDLLEYSRKVALPISNYSIKTLAPHAGFNWSVDGAGGAMSLLKYRDATNPQSPDQSAMQWLIDYNKDDVRATFAVREYLRSLKLSG